MYPSEVKVCSYEICTHVYSIIIHTSSTVKESACNARDLGSIPGLGRSPGEGKGYHSYSGLVAKSWTQLSDFLLLYIIAKM